MQSKSIDTGQLSAASDEELIDVLIAISIVAKRLANNLRKMSEKNGGKKDGKNE